jgi:hypothetical protein
VNAPYRWLTPSRRGSFLLGLQVVLAAVLFAVLEFLAARHNVRFDTTPTKQFVLSPQAEKVASHFDRKAEITVFYSSQTPGRRRAMKDLLEQFQSAAPSIRFRLLDLDRSPGLAQKYRISSYNTGVIDVGGETTVLHSVDEGTITNVLLRYSTTGPRNLCFVTGHGERTPNSANDRSGYSEVGKALEREHYTIDEITTIPPTGVPARCTVVILAGPSHELLPGEAASLLRFLRGGGKALILIDPDAPPSVLRLLRDAGIDAETDLVVDEQNRFIGADSFMPQVLRFRTETFHDSLDSPAVLSLARTVRPLQQPPPGVDVVAIAATSPDSWALKGARSAPDESVHFRHGMDEPGPLPVGVMATFERRGPGEAKQSPGKLIVYGDSDFATNFYLNLLGNKDLFMSSVALLAESQQLVAVRHKGLTRGTMSPIFLSARQQRVILWVVVALVPLTCLGLGSIVTLARGRRRGGR